MKWFSHLIAVSAMVPLTLELDQDFAAAHGIDPLVYYHPFLNAPQGCRPLRLAQERVRNFQLPYNCMHFHPNNLQETTAVTVAEKDRLFREMAAAAAALYQPDKFDAIRMEFIGLFTVNIAGNRLILSYNPNHFVLMSTMFALDA